MRPRCHVAKHLRSEVIGGIERLEHGTQDQSCPPPMTGERTPSLIPGARLKVIVGAPHGLMLTHAELVNAELLQFLRSA